MAAERSSSAHTSDVTPGPKYLTLICFGIIYFVWGSTFLAIRVGVREVPPLVLASMRFFVAGGFLVAWMRMRGEKFPTAREWRSASLLGIVIFLFDYGLLFWSERRVPSGIAAVMLGTIPVFMALCEIIFLKTQKLTLGLAIGLLTGLCGVAVLMSPALHLGGAPVDKLGAAALLFASVSWSIASVIARKAPLPESKVMSSGAQMLSGGIFLATAAVVAGEFRGFQVTSVSREAWLALLYLIVAGSIIGFTAYVWLLHHESPTKVGTYAYVNPIVAVIVGYFFGGEALTMRTIVGSACVLLSVVLITLAARKKVAAVSDAARGAAPVIADAD
jgi:drug/metabolite transporter (DMT)-like permease